MQLLLAQSIIVYLRGTDFSRFHRRERERERERENLLEGYVKTNSGKRALLAHAREFEFAVALQVLARNCGTAERRKITLSLTERTMILPFMRY